MLMAHWKGTCIKVMLRFESGNEIERWIRQRNEHITHILQPKPAIRLQRSDFVIWHRARTDFMHCHALHIFAAYPKTLKWNILAQSIKKFLGDMRVILAIFVFVIISPVVRAESRCKRPASVYRRKSAVKWARGVSLSGRYYGLERSSQIGQPWYWL